MGSLNNGQPILQTNNKLRIHHQSNQLKLSNNIDDTNSVISNSGTISLLGNGTLGVVFHPENGTSVTSSGLSLIKRDADNSVEREKFTITGLPSGALLHHRTRKIDGIHVSVTNTQASGNLSPYVIQTERKVFFVDSDRGLSSGFADWTIYDSSGEAVGATLGTTDTDITPTGIGG